MARPRQLKYYRRTLDGDGSIMAQAETTSRGKRIGLLLGPAVLVLMLLLPVPPGMKPAAWKVAAVTALMAIWWISEAIPIPATSLLPIALFPLLGVMPSKQATTPYANHLIYLFMAGFFLAVTMERWNLHRRIALHTIRLVGVSPRRMILGFMSATGFLSMWVSNTATTMMMVPIGMAVIRQTAGFDATESAAGPDRALKDNFARALMLGIAYAASLGGVATLIGTPPNTVMAGMVEKMYGVQIGFARWMLFGVPLSVLMIGVTWLLLTRVLFPTGGLQLSGGREVLEREIAALGPMSRQEKLIVVIGLLVASAWIARGFLLKADTVLAVWPSFPMVHDTTIGIVAALILFAVPTSLKRWEFLLDWKTAVKIPWDVIILFGGGLAIAKGFAETGLAGYIADQFRVLQGASMVVFVGAAVLVTIFLTEITSNTATATLLVPIMGSAAVAMGIHPYATIVSACVAASFAFMLPVATPPNAVVFGSGCVSIKEMARAGFWINLLSTVAITLFVAYLLPLLWGVDYSVLPGWATPG